MVGAAGFVIAYLLVAFALFPATIVPFDTKVPSLTGMQYNDAVRRLERDGFRATTREQRYHASAPSGAILAQAPAAGSVEPKGTTVALDVSRGQQDGEVPSVVGLTQGRAEMALGNAGLEVGQVTLVDGEEARGQVVSSDPPGGTKVLVPSEVSITVSKGPASVEIPDVTGQSLDAARSLLRQLGLRVETQADSGSSMPAGTIVEQRPAGGRRTRAGGSVTLTVSGAVP